MTCGILRGMTQAAKKTRGGPDRGQGRHTLIKDEPTVTKSMRMPESVAKKLDRLATADGVTVSEWVRRAVEGAEDPA